VSPCVDSKKGGPDESRLPELPIAVPPLPSVLTGRVLTKRVLTSRVLTKRVLTGRVLSCGSSYGRWSSNRVPSDVYGVASGSFPSVSGP
jgi:hypothetical protein